MFSNAQLFHRLCMTRAFTSVWLIRRPSFLLVDAFWQRVATADISSSGTKQGACERCPALCNIPWHCFVPYSGTASSHTKGTVLGASSHREPPHPLPHPGCTPSDVAVPCVLQRRGGSQDQGRRSRRQRPGTPPPSPHGLFPAPLPGARSCDKSGLVTSWSLISDPLLSRRGAGCLLPPSECECMCVRMSFRLLAVLACSRAGAPPSMLLTAPEGLCRSQ